MYRIILSSRIWILIGSIALLSACSVTQELESTLEATSIPLPHSATQPSSTPLPVVTKMVPEQTPIIMPTSTEEAVATASLTWENTPESTAFSAAASSDLLEGPLIVYLVQNSDRYLLLLDIGTLTFREIKRGQLQISGLHWLDDGCHLFTGDNIIDLQGNVIEKIDDPETEDRFQVILLSPDRQKGVRDIFLGGQEDVELDYLTLEILDRDFPDKAITLATNGGAYAYAWSPDGNWLAFTDFDENFILQLYRATPDGEIVEQITSHFEDPGVIKIIAWSPDGQHISYAAQAFLPGQSEGWIGLVSLTDLQTEVIKPDYFQYALGLWWSQDGKRIAFVGDSFSNAPVALRGRQIHWVDSISGRILNSFYEYQAPSQFLSLVTLVGNVDTVFFEAMDGYYLLDAPTHNYRRILDDIPRDGLIRDFSASPFTFPGEANCQQ